MNIDNACTILMLKECVYVSFLYCMMADEYGRVTSGQFQYIFKKHNTVWLVGKFDCVINNIASFKK